MNITYGDGEHELEGYLAARDPAHECPGVLVVPTWLNVNESIRGRADRLAAFGYTVFVADLFGAGIRPGPPLSPMDVVAPWLDDRLVFRRRLLAGLHALQRRPECDPDRIAAVGYCLGGCGVLELARARAPVRGVVSLHGLLSAPIPATVGSVEAKVLVLHGDADPLVPLDQVAAFREEMRFAQANWQVTIYGEARHSFTGEGIADRMGPEAEFQAQAASRSWRSTLDFLEEVLTQDLRGCEDRGSMKSRPAC